MRRRVFLVLLLIPLYAQDYRLALPGYHYEFPRDHFSHPDFQTEWWYYTGNLRDSSGHRFGFELTFFRQAVASPKEDSIAPVWRPDQMYLAHLALSDLDGRAFYHTERLNRAGPGIAGAGLTHRKYWNGNWQVYWKSLASGEQKLQAVCREFSLSLTLNPLKPPVINGQQGVSLKGPAPGEASHYISFTRLGASGQLQRNGATRSLNGLAWMDHEFFTESSKSGLAGWDWFAIQLDNNEELMLYRLRATSGLADPYSSGTYVDAHGAAHFLRADQFWLSPGSLWHSPQSGHDYPLAWQIMIPSLDLALAARTDLPNQELFSTHGISPTYWEGAVTYRGTFRRQPVTGVGYLEMTSTWPIPRNSSSTPLPPTAHSAK